MTQHAHWNVIKIAHNTRDVQWDPHDDIGNGDADKKWTMGEINADNAVFNLNHCKMVQAASAAPIQPAMATKQPI